MGFNVRGEGIIDDYICQVIRYPPWLASGHLSNPNIALI